MSSVPDSMREFPDVRSGEHGTADDFFIHRAIDLAWKGSGGTQPNPMVGAVMVSGGRVIGEGYHELGSNAYAFVETSGVGGTHPALVEAMAFGNCVVTHDTPENLETIGDTGLAYAGREGAESLRAVLRRLVDAPHTVQGYREKAEARARRHYSWEAVTDDYERLFYRTLKRPCPGRLTE